MRTLLVDGKNIAYRCFVGGAMSTEEGTRTEVPFLYIKILSKIVREIGDVDRIYVCWDHGLSPYRIALYPPYKQRAQDSIAPSLQRTRREIERQRPILKEFLMSMGVGYIELPNTEADDIIALLAVRSSFLGEEAYIISSDKDYLQLVGKNLNVYDGRGRVVTIENFAEYQKGLTPIGFSYAHAILGDGSDNIPGVHGVGWSTIIKLQDPLNRARNLEEVFQLITQICREKKDHRIQKIVENWEAVQRNYKLINLRRPPIRGEEALRFYDRVDQIRIPKFDGGRLMELMKYYEMQSLIMKFNYWMSPFERLS